MELADAQRVAKDLVRELALFCDRIEVAGSIRRRRPFVNDIDLVLIPKNQGLLDTKLRELGCRFGGPKLRRLVYPHPRTERSPQGAQVDIYIATPETWAVLLLIRTGSTRHNVRLCTRARALGLQLKADGQGLVDDLGNRVAGDTEASIFDVLGLPYREPWERE